MLAAEFLNLLFSITLFYFYFSKLNVIWNNAGLRRGVIFVRVLRKRAREHSHRQNTRRAIVESLFCREKVPISYPFIPSTESIRRLTRREG